jgi:signal transduction histidine kinase
MGGSPRTAARLGGVLFALSGVLALANAAAPDLGRGGRTAVALVGAADLVLAVLAFALPWERWRPRATLVLMLAAFAVIAGANRYSEVPAYSYGVFFVVVFAWIGACHRPGTSVVLAPPATLAYLLPFLTEPAANGEVARSSVVAIPVCVMVGEVLSLAMGKVRTAQAAAERSSADLARALSEREALDRLKTDIISIVSHELRTPLTSMGASLEILADDLLADAGPEARRMLAIASANTERLTRLVNDMLSLDQIGSGDGGLRLPCSGPDLVERAVERMGPGVDAAGLRMVVAGAPVTVEADPNRIVQALSQLIGNAIKFSASGGVITVEVEPDGDQARFTVADTGRGIPADKLQHIFNPFEQVEAPDRREQGGTGLGLAICRGIVTAHHGRIWAESRLGSGTTVTFTLPAVTGADRTTRPSAASAPAS